MVKCKLGFHNWSGCKCADCGKTRDKNHVYILYTCENCGAFDYLRYLDELYFTAFVGNIIIGGGLIENPKVAKSRAIKDLSKCKTEVQKQEMILGTHAYLVNVVAQSVGTDRIILASNQLLKIQKRMDELGKKYKEGLKI